MHDRRDSHLPEKVNKILHVILVALFLIVLRIWHLAVIQHDEKLEQALKPQRRILLEPAKRGTVRDRFNEPLAVNTMKYNAAILYSEIRQIPTISWEKGSDGKRIKRFKRKEYIAQLANLLGEELKLDPVRVEDLIHSKASFYSHMPFIIKENISEVEYFRLRMLEKDWLGMHVQHLPRRYYPRGKVGADIIGYMGAINREEYEKILREMSTLEDFLENEQQGLNPEFPPQVATIEEAEERLKTLCEKTYSIQDSIGKAGVERSFERILRGSHGRKSFYSDAKGNFLRQLPETRPPQSGQRILLTISAELQEYAEKLLAQNEKIRLAQVSVNETTKRMPMSLHQPWIKGGAIVAMDPNTGEILALASYPRFDPNDFSSSKRTRIAEWLENEQAIADIWDQKRPLERERFDDKKGIFYDEERFLTWDFYLERILPAGHPVLKAIGKVGNIANAIAVQQNADLDSYDKTLLVDLCRLCVRASDFNPDLLEMKGSETLSDYRQACGAKVVIEEVVKEISSDLFDEIAFKQWRKQNEKIYLKEKRIEEKAAKTYQKPYIDYLDAEESKQFKEFWEGHRWHLLLTFLTGQKSCFSPYEEHFCAWYKEIVRGAHQQLPWYKSYCHLQEAIGGLNREIAIQYLQTMRSYKELNSPLLGHYRSLRGQLEKHLAAAFYPKQGFGYGRSQTYRQAAPLGSIFKLVTAYAGLIQCYHDGAELNPLVMVDHYHKKGPQSYVGYDKEGSAIPRTYKGGRLPRSPNRKGKLDLLRAIETSSNPYFSLLAGDILKSPEDLSEAARRFSYGAKTGIALPAEITGLVPNDLMTNRSGLYATAIGQHTLIVTPLQTALMLSTMANGGHMKHPQIARTLVKAGSQGTPQIINLPKSDRWIVPFPPSVKKMLIEGMRRVVLRTHNESLAKLSRIFRDYPEAISDYIDLRDEFFGKTSTAEVMENVSLDQLQGTNLYKHVWFGGISFEEGDEERPELVVVVYLRFGIYGKEAAPIAAQMVEKWRSIKALK